MDEVKVTVSIPDADRFESAVEAASAIGLKVHNKLDILGIANGSISSSALPKLRNVPGIGSVEVQREVGVPTRVQ